jgi:hypothetical protein
LDGKALTSFLCDPPGDDVAFVRELIERFDRSHASEAWALFDERDDWQRCGPPSAIAVGILGGKHELKLLIGVVAQRDTVELGGARLAWAVRALALLVGKSKGRDGFEAGLGLLLECASVDFWRGRLNSGAESQVEKQLAEVCLESLPYTRNEVARRTIVDALQREPQSSTLLIANDRLSMLAAHDEEIERWLSKLVEQ